jgi:signal transduction histidine kinase
LRELALHILDLVENALRAQATIVAVNIEALPDADVLRIVIEDNGRGLQVTPAQALNPFYTTKSGKRTGLGLSLFRAAAESTGGRLEIGQSTLGPVGVRVAVELGLRHVDRMPLGDLGGTLAALVCTNPAVDFRFTLRCGDQACTVRAADVAGEPGVGGGGALAVAQRVMARVNHVLQNTDVPT